MRIARKHAQRIDGRPYCNARNGQVAGELEEITCKQCQNLIQVRRLRNAK